jgi:hypothetical protein
VTPVVAVDEPVITVKQVVKEWVDTKKKQDGTRLDIRHKNRAFPVDPDSSTNIDAFIQWINFKLVKKGSQRYHRSGIRMALAMFDLNGASLAQFMNQLLEKDLLIEVLGYQLMDTHSAWATKILATLGKACKHFKLKTRVVDNPQFKENMECMLEDIIQPRLALCSKARKEDERIRDEEDFDVVTNILPPGAMKEAVQIMMKDLVTCAWAQEKKKAGNWKHYATSIEAAILFMSQCNSRPGHTRRDPLIKKIMILICLKKQTNCTPSVPSSLTGWLDGWPVGPPNEMRALG